MFALLNLSNVFVFLYGSNKLSDNFTITFLFIAHRNAPSDFLFPYFPSSFLVSLQKTLCFVLDFVLKRHFSPKSALYFPLFIEKYNKEILRLLYCVNRHNKRVS